MANKVLTQEDYLKILQNKFNTKDIDFIGAKWERISNNVEGYMGEHETLKLIYSLGKTENTATFFVKTKLEKYSDTIKRLNTYEKEIFVYDFILVEFEKMGYNIDFAPKGFYCKDNKSIVMEDMKMNGYVLFERDNFFFDVNHCKAALKSLAQFHANSIAYEETKTKELGRLYRFKDEYPENFNDILFIPNDKEGAGWKFLEATLNCFDTLCDYMPESPEWKKSFKERLKKFDCVSIFHKYLPSRQTLGHGDLWFNNTLFKYKNKIPVHCCLIDFQLIRYHHQAYDVILLIHSNTQRQFRKQYMSLLLKYYYETFESILKTNGYNAREILPEEDFLTAAKTYEPTAAFQGLATRNLVLLPPEVTTKEDSTGNLEGIIFSDRTKIVVECFNKNDRLRKMYIDDMYELNDHM